MPISRKKACVHCRVSKTRCNLASPCARCSQRCLPCHYGDALATHLPHSTGQISQHPLVTRDSDGMSNEFQHPNSIQTSGAIATTIPGYTIPSHVQDFEFTEDDHISPAFSLTDITGEATDSWNRADSLFSGPSLGINDTLPDLVTPGALGYMLQQQIQMTVSLQANEISARSQSLSPAFGDAGRTGQPSPGTEDNSVPAIEQRPLNTYGKIFRDIWYPKQPAISKSSLTLQLIRGQIRAFPRTMIQGQLPPFIYPPCILQDKLPKACVANGVHQCLPESLAYCASLACMFYGRTAISSPLFWRVVFTELKRLKSEYQDYDEPMLLSSVQSTTIYMLLLSQDLESVEQNDVGYMLSTLIEMAHQLQRSSRFLEDIYSTQTLTQREWAFHESSRRTFGVIYLVETLLKAMTGYRATADCLDFEPVPLPCPRALWDYNSSEAWSHRLDRYMLEREPSGKMLTIRDLQLAGGTCRGIGERLVDMARWCDSADEFGGLLWMVATID